MKAVPTLHPGDCRETLAALACVGEEFDACVTDPPYDLVSVVRRFGSPTAAPAQHGTDGAFARQSRGFMGKQWDGTGIAFDPATWRAVYDVLRPGAYLLAFGGTRTYHRMAVAIEDAGFEIRDCLMWVYGTGFPKSHDVSKAIDREAGAERAQVAPRSVIGHQRNLGNHRPYMDNPAHTTAGDIPATPEAAEWAGWGTALKPAVEPIVMARKPLAHGATVAANVLAHGTGALNIDGCRITLAPGDPLQDGITGRTGAPMDTGDADSSWGFRAVDRAAGLGRWPANLVHDGSPEVLAAFPAAPGQIIAARADGAPKTGNVYGAMKHPSKGVRHAKPGRNDGYGMDKRGDTEFVKYNDSGSAARFFYSAKAAKSDRLCGDVPTKHPTVKPIALLRWLCRLVTRPGGRILDPFAGSGTTLAAAWHEGFDAVGCEREPEYVADIRRRLDALNRAPGVSAADTAAALAEFLA